MLGGKGFAGVYKSFAHVKQEQRVYKWFAYDVVYRY